MSEEKLRNCPFCGGKARVTGSESLGTINYYCVYCTECNTWTDEYAGRQSAIEAWNRRYKEQDDDR